MRSALTAGVRVILWSGLWVSSAARASEVPKHGGTLNFAVVAEPPTTDCHATTTFAMVHPVASQYSRLLAFVGPHDKIKIEGDLAQSWEVAKDGLNYTFKLRRGVKFHDGSDFTSEEVKATYERIINPPAGVVSARRAQHQDIQTIQTPDPYTVVFELARVNTSMELHFASPFNCVYSARELKQDPKYPESEVMGTGAFKFLEYVKGSHWRAVRFDQHFRPDRPHLDGHKAIFVRSNTVVNGLRGGQYDAEFRGDFADDQTAQFNTLLSKQASAIAYSRHSDNKLDDLFNRQSQIVDPQERLNVVNAFERHALTMAYNIPLLWYQRIVVNNKKVKDWDLTHFTGQNLVEVWLND
jgi:ABC-type transport system substrate-binding protein